MAKVKDLSRNFSKLPAAEEEVVIPVLNTSPGQNIGGVSMYGNSMRRGTGDEVFGVDERGQWMGAADFDNAPYQVSRKGKVRISSDDGENSSVLTAEVLIFYRNNIPEIVLGIA